MKAPIRSRQRATSAANALPDLYAMNMGAIEALRGVLETLKASPAQGNDASLSLLVQMLDDLDPKREERDDGRRFMAANVTLEFIQAIMQYFANRADFHTWLNERRQQVEKRHGRTIEQRAAAARRDSALQRLIASAINNPSLGESK